jgi:hypothetical protein
VMAVVCVVVALSTIRSIIVAGSNASWNRKSWVTGDDPPGDAVEELVVVGEQDEHLVDPLLWGWRG